MGFWMGGASGSEPIVVDVAAKLGGPRDAQRRLEDEDGEIILFIAAFMDMIQ